MFRRFATILALAMWMGGFTFYAEIVIPTATHVLGSGQRVGFIRGDLFEADKWIIRSHGHAKRISAELFEFDSLRAKIQIFQHDRQMQFTAVQTFDKFAERSVMEQYIRSALRDGESG